MAKRPKPVPQMTVAQFEAAFPDEDACRAYLVARRWPDGVHCPRCGNPAVHTQRLVASEDLIVVGAGGMYEARCRRCFEPHLAHEQQPPAPAANSASK